METLEEKKKSFWQVYTVVSVFYVIMIIVYGVVVHNATEDGAKGVAPSEADCPGQSNPFATTTATSAVKTLLSLVSDAASGSASFAAEMTQKLFAQD